MKRVLTTTVLLLNTLFAFSQVTYQYDNLNRLQKVTYPNGTTIDYAYNELGNRSTKVVNAISNGIEDIAANQLFIFPNPAKNELFIQSELPVENVEIYNLIGLRMIICDWQNNKPVNISSLPAGAYIVRIHTDRGITDKKLVKTLTM
jgi:YD repeat-containing protein